jgi:hypothetical protein
VKEEPAPDKAEELLITRDLLIHTSIYGEIFYLRPRFFTLGVYKISDFGKKEQLI